MDMIEMRPEYENDEILIINDISQELVYVLIKERKIYLRVDYGLWNETIDFKELKALGISQQTIQEIKDLYKQ